MTEIHNILTSKFPKTVDRIEGRLVFLDQHEINKVISHKLEALCKLDFYQAKFFTGYHKFTIIDVIVGCSKDNEVFLLTNPLFSERYSNLIPVLENINAEQVNQEVITEIVECYKRTGAKITAINEHNFQIWFGESAWHILSFEFNQNLKIKSTPNSKALNLRPKWWQIILGS